MVAAAVVVVVVVVVRGGKLALGAHTLSTYYAQHKAHTSPLDTDLTRNTRAPHFTPQHWLLCHMGLY